MSDPEVLKLQPYWRYIHSGTALNPRHQHLAWHGLTLPAEHEFWQTHFAPNGWGCGCRIESVTRREGEASARAGLGEPPAGWATINPKTGAPVGIDKGFGYAPGASWHPNLDKYPFELAREVVAANLKDGVFERWHKTLGAKVTAELAKPDVGTLDKAQQTARVRQLTQGEEMPVAVISPMVRLAMGVLTQVVKVSDHDLLKQGISRSNQAFDAARYFAVQPTLDAARLIVRETGQMTVFVSDAAGQWYAAVLQQTRTGLAVYLKSWRRSSPRDARTQMNKVGAAVLLNNMKAEDV